MLFKILGTTVALAAAVICILASSEAQKIFFIYCFLLHVLSADALC